NALLNATLGMPMSGGGGVGKDAKKESGKHKANEHEIKSAKIMEDLVVPSSLYYGKPVNNHKVFNYKKGKRDKDKKSRDSSSDNESDDNVIEESSSIEGTLFIFYASGKFVFGDLKALANNNYQSGTYKLDNENDNLQIQINGKKWDFNFEVSSNMEIILRPTTDSETNYSYLLIPFPEP
ncbi:MAG: hypothetical protein EBU01_05510, partial [Crocinitomicaceae bacterium]|nr:hypothetical protein [Crocinitomicaceae bacterium]